MMAGFLHRLVAYTLALTIAACAVVAVFEGAQFAAQILEGKIG